MFNKALKIIMWQGVRFHYHCADNHYIIIIIIMKICKAPTLRLKTLSKHTHIMYIEMENVTKKINLKKWQDFVLFVTVLTIIIWQGVCFHYHCADNHYMAGSLFCLSQHRQSAWSWFPSTQYRHSTTWQEIYTR